jgi:hypothetical protein
MGWRSCPSSGTGVVYLQPEQEPNDGQVSIARRVGLGREDEQLEPQLQAEAEPLQPQPDMLMICLSWRGVVVCV